MHVYDDFSIADVLKHCPLGSYRRVSISATKHCYHAVMVVESMFIQGFCQRSAVVILHITQQRVVASELGDTKRNHIFYICTISKKYQVAEPQPHS